MSLIGWSILWGCVKRGCPSWSTNQNCVWVCIIFCVFLIGWSVLCGCAKCGYPSWSTNQNCIWVCIIFCVFLIGWSVLWGCDKRGCPSWSTNQNSTSLIFVISVSFSIDWFLLIGWLCLINFCFSFYWLISSDIIF